MSTLWQEAMIEVFRETTLRIAHLLPKLLALVTFLALGLAAAWLIKVLTLRGGGIRLYRGLLPFFLGVLLGDFLFPMGWAVIGLLTGQQMYLSFPH